MPSRCRCWDWKSARRPALAGSKTSGRLAVTIQNHALRERRDKRGSQSGNIGGSSGGACCRAVAAASASSFLKLPE
jgi:hypothetical protein